MENPVEFDYVIVGAGTAGCVLANRLSENPSMRILLLEAGGKDTYPWIHIPVGYLYCIANPRTDWCFQTEPEAGLNGRALHYARGKVLGGCSSINGMIYMRGQRQDYDQWRQLGNIGWAWDDVLPLFLKSEDHFAGATAMHGAGGNWRVEKQRVSWDILEAFQRACTEAGIPETEDFNLGDNEGSSFFHVNQRSGWRWSAARGFLNPVKSRPNLTVLTKAQTSKILFTGKKAIGVKYTQNGTSRTAMAKRSVILSAGAICSPQLLQLSGIGPGTLLRDKGVEVVHELAGVGENLQDHLQIRCVYEVSNTKTMNEKAHSWLSKASIGLEYALKRTGPMSMAPSQLGVFTKSDPALETPDLQYHVQPVSLDKFGDDPHTFPAITASVCNLRPHSRGSVRLKSSNPADQPAIAPNYLSTDHDRIVAAKSIELTRKIVSQPALSPFMPLEFKPGSDVTSHDDLVRAAGDIGTTIFHPVGTAKMGHDNMAVVDERLRVRGIENLRVIDASIMPVITSGNTNSPTIMIAEKGAQMLLEDQ